MTPDAHRSFSPAQLRRVLHRVGGLILLVGFVAAGCIWSLQPDQASTASNNEFLSPADSAKYQRQLEIYYGKFGVLTDQWLREAGKLSHGRPLAITIATISLVAGVGCFAASAVLQRALHRMSRSRP